MSKNVYNINNCSMQTAYMCSVDRKVLKTADKSTLRFNSDSLNGLFLTIPGN